MWQSYVFLACTMLILDIAWLTFQKGGYQRLVTKVQGQPLKVNMLGAVLSYACVFLSLVFIAIPNIRRLATSRNDLLWVSFKQAGFLGFLIYGVFNFTNIAIFQNYDVVVALTDTMWGTLLYTMVAYFTVYFFPTLEA